MGLLAWLHWDPSSDIIIIPFLELPITWYGFLFATGFWVGFHIFVYMFQRFLVQIAEFRPGDVDFRAWKKKPNPELSTLKENDLETCNALLDQALPEEDERHPLLTFAKRAVSVSVYEKIRKRISLENRFPDVFIPVKQRAKMFTEKVLLYAVVGTIVGARLGHVFFYENPWDYILHPLSILKTWEGGLASHGGILAVVIAMGILYKKTQKSLPELNIATLLDYMSVPTLFVCCMIRLGNFFNQEIVGAKSYQPWAIIFGHPRGGEANIPCHPAQLYEALFYLSIFALLFTVWQRVGYRLLAGQICGLAITIGFFFRFCIEFLKTEQSVWFSDVDHLFNMGQWLSVPMILLGLILFFAGKRVNDFSRSA